MSDPIANAVPFICSDDFQTHCFGGESEFRLWATSGGFAEIHMAEMFALVFIAYFAYLMYSSYLKARRW